MAKYKQLEYPKTQVKKAGRLFSSQRGSEQEREEALRIINNWRAAHAYPMQIIYTNLKNKAPSNAIVAQRLKRLASITAKLSRFPTMSLSTMQDIGGCRIIVDSLSDVYDFVAKVKKSQWKHRFVEEYDYIQFPKADGYRCYHLVYSYRSDKNQTYNGLLIETQIRTRYQHLWATAVETMDEIENDSIKIGKGKEQNRDFFRLASELLRIYEESNYNQDLVRKSIAAKRMKEFEQRSHILARLAAVRSIEQVTNENIWGSDPGYYLLINNALKQRITIRYYSYKAVDHATEAYDEYEKNKQDHEDIVLVSTSSLDTLQNAYPNYFTNIGEFVQLIRTFIA